MAYINQKIKEVFPDLSVMKQTSNNAFFKGRNLPSFVKDFVLRRYTDTEGNIDAESLKSYLDTKMPIDCNHIKQLLIAGESVNITTRFTTTTDIAKKCVKVTIPHLGINSDAYIKDTLLQEKGSELADGDYWGNITLEYVEPEGKRNGYIQVTSYISFEPYKIDLDYFMQARQQFSLDEWIDVLITIMEYNAEMLSQEQKILMLSRMLALVEPRLNMIELGPKGTGKSYVYTNLSKYAWLLGGGKTSRARLFYNKTTKQFGVIKNHDVVGMDEISTMTFAEPDEMQSILKVYLESGETKVDNIPFQSECGLVLLGNIPLNKDLKPQHAEYFRNLPEMFRESATLDRFHGFIEGWKLPRLNKSHIMEGWTLNVEYFSTILHILRSESNSDNLFEQLVQTSEDCDLRDKKAIKRTASAFHKLLFPHVHSIDEIEQEDQENFKRLYAHYCLEPAINMRRIIRQQCHLLDKEFKAEMGEFKMRE